ncbi:hypothetical protein [Demequina iriomotensis]|uniref:hypothetical protein n=1 Tax=Demequina iriomotensis TaxID=1536641 RepID=UPI000781AA2C|nr:hypothetical protein [Demequina iriomotensis]
MGHYIEMPAPASRPELPALRHWIPTMPWEIDVTLSPATADAMAEAAHGLGYLWATMLEGWPRYHQEHITRIDGWANAELGGYCTTWRAMGTVATMWSYQRKDRRDVVQNNVAWHASIAATRAATDLDVAWRGVALPLMHNALPDHPDRFRDVPRAVAPAAVLHPFERGAAQWRTQKSPHAVLKAALTMLAFAALDHDDALHGVGARTLFDWALAGNHLGPSGLSMGMLQRGTDWARCARVLAGPGEIDHDELDTVLREVFLAVGTGAHHLAGSAELFRYANRPERYRGARRALLQDDPVAANILAGVRSIPVWHLDEETLFSDVGVRRGRAALRALADAGFIDAAYDKNARWWTVRARKFRVRLLEPWDLAEPHEFGEPAPDPEY